MKIHIRYTRKGVTHEVSTTLGVIVAWERKFKRKASEMGAAMGIEDIAYLAFEASKVHGLVMPAAFDDFLNQLENIEVFSEEQENPTQGVQTDEL
jgi:hypothetical protein